MQIAVKYRLYPTSSQETTLLETFDLCREVYNSMVHWRKFDFEVHGESPTAYDQRMALPRWKEAHPELCQVNAQVLQNVATRVDLAFQAFFRRVEQGQNPGYPRFKGAGQYDSFTYPQATAFGVGFDSLRLSKIGCVKAVVHRALPGTAKTCTVRLQSGKWFACITCEVEAKPLPESKRQVGIDVGLNHFASTSDGEFIANPRFFRKDEKALAKAQRKVERIKACRTADRKARLRKANRVVARIHERTRNRRHNFVHQLSRKVVNQYDLIAVEALAVENMMRRPAPRPDPENEGLFLRNGASQKSGLNKSISDAAWSMFRSVLTYKAERAGRQVVNVDPAYTSQDCSRCGNRVPKSRSERIHACPYCGLILDRDVNAARNVLKKGMGLHTVPARQDRSPRVYAGE